MIFRKPYASEAANWSFLTNHARVLLCVAHDPGVRLRDIAASLDITERGAFGILTDLAEAGYVVKEKVKRLACNDLLDIMSSKSTLATCVSACSGTSPEPVH